jgi:HD-GYP domain-containing protein (c-di-GMP phosphodiesterase class II)
MSKSLYLTRTAESRTQAFRRAELLGALSYALDLTEGQPQGHCIRCCWIGTRIGEVLNLPADMLGDLYYTLLLKDLGCSSNAARICELYLADDISFKRDFKTIDGSLSSALRFVFKKTGLESGLSERIRAIVNILQNGGEISRSLIETRCHRGADIAARMRFSEAVQNGILSLDEHWDGSGKPEGLKAQEIPAIANIALLAQVIDIFHTENGVAARRFVKPRRAPETGSIPRWSRPSCRPSPIRNSGLRLSHRISRQRVFAMQPGLTSEVVDEDYLDDVAAAFSDVVDAKSPFTADHSNRVTLYTDMIAEELGLDARPPSLASPCCLAA